MLSTTTTLNPKPLIPSTPLHRVINHPWGGCSCSCGITRELESRPRSREKVEEATSLTLQSKANKDNKHFTFPLKDNF